MSLSAAELADKVRANVALVQPHPPARALPPVLTLADRTEAGNAERFIAIHGARVRYVPKWDRFLVWVDEHWQSDDQQVLVTELAKDVGRSWFREAADAASDKDRDAIIAWARLSMSNKGIQNAVRLARGIEGIAVSHESLDADAWLFGVCNGVIDLRAGVLRPAEPSDLMTMQSPVLFDSQARAPRWEQAMAEWFADPAVRHYVQKLVGAAMVGEQLDHVLVIHYGPGRNGKGTFTRAVDHVFGPYARTPHLSLLVQQKHGEHDTVKADLFRCRLAVASETERRVSLAEASVKNLTGGDKITCRRMREDPWEFRPSHSLHLQTNYLPAISGRDRGVWSRIRVVQWESTFDRAPERDLDAVLVAEAPGILAWAVQGCLAWQREGLAEPEAVIRATLAYREAEDVFARFAGDVGLEFAKHLSIAAGELNRLVDEWADAEGAKPKRGELADWLKDKGAHQGRERTAGVKLRMWTGVGLAPTDHSGPDGPGISQSPLKETSLESHWENPGPSGPSVPNDGES